MSVFVTGASGFLGRRICHALKLHGYTVVAGLRREVDGPWDRVVFHDLEDKPVSESDIRGVSCILHLAGKAHALGENTQDNREYKRINVLGTHRLLETSQRAGVNRIVYFSSVKAMGEDVRFTLDETDECHPETPYGASKLEAERLVMTGGYIPEPIVLRLSMVYGATHKGNLPRMIDAVRSGRFPPLPEVGNKRTMVHVNDVVQAALLALQKSQAAGNTYIVTDGNYYSTRQIYLSICEALGRRAPDWTVPVGLLRVVAAVGDVIGKLSGKRFVFDSDALDKLIGSACFSSARIADQLGFRPQHDLQSSLPELLSYLGRACSDN